MIETMPARPHSPGACPPGACPLDHLVLPTASLDVARARLVSLGFVVAPTGIHPFGTENCCVFLEDGTYLEPLAVGNAQAAAKAVGDGNVFVARDRAYRDSCGNEGFSALVLGTQNADADHARYVEAGLSAGDMLSFSRAFTDAAGNSDAASFKLAFASGTGATDAFLFTCERINAPKVDRSALQVHANGATGIIEVVAVSNEPSKQRRLISIATRSPATGQGSSTAFDLPNATLTLLDPIAFETRFGIAAGAPSELRFAAIVFSVRFADTVARLLAARSVEHDIRGDDIVVRPASGQGAAFVFQEKA
ncbi:VOC family protein [Mesorhizobium sp.]|uniref:VOC family protein n=2 Tax=Mesorhizobium sp. TaxID=1871066 RepID=UPI000FE4A9CE|nr:VOC family protein [Mesorhizobium sp.]RWK40654.1 MAG: VOC family protein [Mesorhizobium sp.]RWK62722.1 MAG: VOC family protein [Mesorhizobium sp.]RWK77555.1 MAG: VOC family protein [Mesorhizobium sp.]RWL03153.1 MAG: VOC family protein [Mesorhizobium sp.]RWL10671.1 MAG: VOC family protein [Mesorhizobium sp.]